MAQRVNTLVTKLLLKVNALSWESGLDMVEKSVMAGGGAPAEPNAMQESVPRDAGLGDLAGAIWRRKIWVFLPLILVTAATYVYLTTTPERYTSQARLLIEDRQTVFTKAQGELQSATLFDKEAVASQVQIITAREVAQAVSDQLKLTTKPEFDPANQPASLLKRTLVTLGLSPDKARMAAVERAIEAYYDRLNVYPIEGSRVIAISFTAQDPQLAADTANAIADYYMTLQQQARQQTTSDATVWLGGQIEELRGKVESAEARVEAYKSENGLRGGGETQAPLSQQQLTDLNRELVVAKTARAEAAARADTIRRLLDENGEVANAADVVSSPHIERLVEQQVALRRQIAELSPTLLPAHPRMRELKTELQDLRRQINEEAKKVAISLDNEALIATARERAVTESLNAIKAESEKAAKAEVELRALEREAKAQRELLESFLIRYREAAARQDAQALPAEARIISRATPSSTPSYPKKGPMLAIAMLATLVISVSLIIASELMRFARRTPPPAPTVNLPPREVSLPRKSRPTAEKVRPIPQTTSEPAGVVRLDMHHFPESVRMLGEMVAVAQPDPDKCTKVLLSTPQRQQRNNYLAVNLARLLSATGKRVLLVDASVRTPRLADQIGLDEGPGLYELLSGACAFSEAIKRDPRSRLHVICAGTGKKDLPKIFSPDRVAKLIEALDGSYEFVLLDAPPVALSPETKGLAAFVDMAVLLADTLPGSAKLMDKAVDALNASAQHGINVVEAEPTTAEMVRLPGDEARRQVA